MFRFSFLLALLPFAAALAEPIPPVPRMVGVVYNSSIPESKKLAETYAAARAIPAENLIGLPLSQQEEISREEYDKTLKLPLISEYDSRGWWKRAKNADGKLAPIEMKIRILACMRGVPSRIRQEGDRGQPKEGEPPFTLTNEAAVDSELSMIAIQDLPINGFLRNLYYQQDTAFLQTQSPTILVGRIDGPTWEVCNRMIKDAIETEKTGLWGMAAIDLSKKYPQGDQWLESIIKEHVKRGIPTIVDRFTDTLPQGYPLRDLAIYYGWYDWHVSGPFQNPSFKFKKGAIAVHLHSFSAAQLRDSGHNWSAPLLARGAAATVGNVYEPYLEMTHHFDILQDRLLKGYTLVEAAYMSVPVLSWQNVVLGDPLYRPFLRLADGSGEKTDADRDYRVFQMATEKWGSDPKKLEGMLNEAVERLQSGTVAEAHGLSLADQGLDALAILEFAKAKKLYTNPADRLRIDLHQIAIERNQGRTGTALRMLNEAKDTYRGQPGAEAVAAWLNILDPPAPAPAKAK